MRSAIRKHGRPLLSVLRTRFGFRPRQEHAPVDHPYDKDEGEDEDEDVFVWDVPNPFDPPDPTQAHIQTLIQAEITRMRRYESIGPLQSLPDEDDEDDWDECESDGDDHDHDAGDEDEDEDTGDDECECEYEADGDDEDEDDTDASDDDSEDTDLKPTTIALPKLLHTVPLCYLPLSTPVRPGSSGTITTTAPWADLARVYNDLAEAEERASRKAKRDTYRSRLKALAILGPEAISAI